MRTSTLALGLALSLTLTACSPEQTADPAPEPIASATTNANTSAGANTPTATPSPEETPAPSPSSSASNPVIDTPEADEAAIRALLDPIFASYANDAPAAGQLGTGAILEPVLAARMAQLQEAAMHYEGIYHEVFSYDPVCRCQDWYETAHTIDSITLNGDLAQAVVSFTNFGEVEARVIDLVRTAKGWRIYDMDGTFREEAMKD